MKVPLGLGYYEIRAHVQTTNDTVEGAWPGVILLPVFYLHEAVEGVISPVSAAQTARKLLDPLHIHGASLIIRATRRPSGGYWVSPPRPLESISGITWHERRQHPQ